MLFYKEEDLSYYPIGEVNKIIQDIPVPGWRFIHGGDRLKNHNKV
jgi:hypothetical protein